MAAAFLQAADAVHCTFTTVADDEMRIALLGTDGLPPRYGGFETFVAHVSVELARRDNDVVVIGSSVGRTRSSQDSHFEGVRIEYLPLRANGVWSVLFDLVSLLRCMWRVEAIVLLGVSGGLAVPVIRMLAPRVRIVVNVDGMETRRAKWSKFARFLLSASEAAAVRFAHAVVADNPAIARIVFSTYGVKPTTLAYGCDHVRILDRGEAQGVLDELLGGGRVEYFLTIARIEPENNIDLMVRAFLKSSASLYVIVGNFSTSAHGRDLLEKYGREPRLKLLDAIYDPRQLAALRAGCIAYLHGHSVGGTNPSLVEVLPYLRPIIAFDCVFNRETLACECAYFSDEDELERLLGEGQFHRYIPSYSLVSSDAYRWGAIAKGYLRISEGRA